MKKIQSMKAEALDDVPGHDAGPSKKSPALVETGAERRLCTQPNASHRPPRRQPPPAVHPLRRAQLDCSRSSPDRNLALHRSAPSVHTCSEGGWYKPC